VVKIYGILVFILFAPGISGQNFTEISSNLQKNGSPSLSWGDFDNDGDLDILVSGYDSVRLYRNNGSGYFTDIKAGLPALSSPASDWGDYDNDGDLDVVIAGKPGDTTSIAYIFRNDNGVFTDIQAGLTGFGNGSAEWGDFDNDGDLDLLLSGENERTDATTKIYRNDGNDRFSEDDRGLPGVSGGIATWGDFDNDHDLDILLCGRDISGNSLTAIYRNDGNTFTDIQAGLTGIQNGTVLWGDYNADNREDIFVSGGTLSKVYFQNEHNEFIDSNADLPQLEFALADQGDFDNDGFTDILMAGSYGTDIGGSYENIEITEIYRYTNDKGFMLYDTSFAKIGQGDIRCADFDNDGDLDIVFAGYFYPGWEKAIMAYRNDVSNKNDLPSTPLNLRSKTEGSSAILSWSRSSDSKTPSKGMSYNLRIGTTPGGIEIVSPMSDLSSGRRRIVSSGNTSSDTSWIIKSLKPGTYYWSVQSIDRGYLASPFAVEASFTILDPFTDMRANIDSVFRGSITWGDYNNDNFYDLILTGAYEWAVASGQPKHIQSIAKIYRNDSASGFTEILNLPGGLYHSSSAWGDYDNDGDLDALMTGEQMNEELQIDTTIAILYQNMGNDHFQNLNLNLRAVYHGTGLWADFDNDGDLDILLTGGNYQFGPTAIIYRNEGNNMFTETSPDISQCSNCNTAYADVDNDGDLDIAHICGSANAEIYINTGDLHFEKAETDLPEATQGLISFCDYDNDYDMDLMIAGRNDNVYTTMFNNEGGSFYEKPGNLRGVILGSARWGDYDMDGDADLILTGMSGRYIALLYSNDGNQHILTECDPGLAGVMYGNAEWADYDNDGDLDIALNGFSDQAWVTKIYRNNGNWLNKQPEIPDSLRSEIKGFDVLLKWNRCTDKENEGGVTYNVRIDTISGKGGKTSVMSDLITGRRWLPAAGNAGVNNFYLIKNLSPGKYYWSVQAVDNTFKGGLWAEESSFDLGDVYVDFDFNTVCLSLPTSFTDLSLSREGPIVAWHWDFSDGETSSNRSPIHFFAQAGEFDVTLTITVNSNSFERTKRVIVKPRPMADFTFIPVSEGGEIMQFNNQSDTVGIAITAWKWDFGDGTVSDKKDPPQHGYLSTGRYTVQLSVTCSNGCSDSVSKEIQICHGMPKRPELRAFGPNLWYLICSNDTAKFYKWFYNGSSVYNKYTYVYFAYQNLGEYQVAISNDDECYVFSDVVGIPPASVELTADNEDKIIIYPNPGNGHFFLCNLTSDSRKINYRLMGICGNEISCGQLETTNNSAIHVNFSFLKDGLYIIEIFSDESIFYTGMLVIDK
jgi:PKD repeat protein